MRCMSSAVEASSHFTTVGIITLEASSLSSSNAKEYKDWKLFAIFNNNNIQLAKNSISSSLTAEGVKIPMLVNRRVMYSGGV